MMAKALSASSQNKFFQQWTKDAAFDGAVLGVLVCDIDKDSSLMSLNAYQNMITASTMKLITTAAALKTLGPDYRFKTELAYSDSIVSGNLRGNLVIKGFGDPTLGSKYFFNDQKAFITKSLTTFSRHTKNGQMISTHYAKVLNQLFLYHHFLLKF